MTDLKQRALAALAEREREREEHRRAQAQLEADNAEKRRQRLLMEFDRLLDRVLGDAAPTPTDFECVVDGITFAMVGHQGNRIVGTHPYRDDIPRLVVRVRCPACGDELQSCREIESLADLGLILSADLPSSHRCPAVEKMERQILLDRADLAADGCPD